MQKKRRNHRRREKEGERERKREKKREKETERGRERGKGGAECGSVLAAGPTDIWHKVAPVPVDDKPVLAGVLGGVQLGGGRRPAQATHPLHVTVHVGCWSKGTVSNAQYVCKLIKRSSRSNIKRRNLYFLSSYRPRQRAHECRGLALWCRYTYMHFSKHVVYRNYSTASQQCTIYLQHKFP